MSFKNIFGGGGNEAKSAEESARNISGGIPGARPERQGLDPELAEGIPEAVRDPKIVRETSPEALGLMNGFLAPMFRNTRTAAADQQAVSEDPHSTSGMAASARDESAKSMKAEIKPEDRPRIDEQNRPKISDAQREETRRSNRDSAGDITRTGDSPAGN